MHILERNSTCEMRRGSALVSALIILVVVAVLG